MAPERMLGALALLLLVVACGVDGPPEPPSAKKERPSSGASITLSGESEAGVVGGS